MNEFKHSDAERPCAGITALHVSGCGILEMSTRPPTRYESVLCRFTGELRDKNILVCTDGCMSAGSTTARYDTSSCSGHSHSYGHSERDTSPVSQQSSGAPFETSAIYTKH